MSGDPDNAVHHVLEADEGHELPGWYFWDETWAFAHGPFGTREDAVAALNVYAEGL